MGEQPIGSDVPGRDALAAEMRKAMRTFRIATYNYGMTYYISRILLIFMSSIVAADHNLASGNTPWLAGWVPILSVMVAAIAAMDTWLKPQQKWRGFMESRDLLGGLLIQLQNGLSTKEAHERFADLLTAHRANNVF